MPCSALDLFALAERLAQDHAEASQRCAMGRAYYAALHVASETFPETGERFDQETSHSYIIRRAREHSLDHSAPARAAAAILAQLLGRMRRARNKADYDLHESILPSEVNDMLARSRRVMGLCNDICRHRETR